MRESGVESAIQELQREVKKIQEAIAVLRRIRPQNPAERSRRGRKRLSTAARRRISQAAKKRWAALRASQKK